MHEMALTQSIIDITTESARQHGAEKVLKITLTVGQLADVVVDSLRFCFEAITPGTMLEGAELEIDEVEAAAVCIQCGVEFQPDPLDFTCPACQNPFTEVIRGKEFAVASIEVDKDVKATEEGRV